MITANDFWYNNPRDRDNSLNICRNAEGLSISISEEKAVYDNMLIECYITLPQVAIEQLRDYLLEQFPK